MPNSYERTINKRKKRVEKVLAYIKEKLQEAQSKGDSKENKFAATEQESVSVLREIVAVSADGGMLSQTMELKIKALNRKHTDLQAKIERCDRDWGYWADVISELYVLHDQIELLYDQGLGNDEKYRAIIKMNQRLIDKLFAMDLDSGLIAELRKIGALLEASYQAADEASQRRNAEREVRQEARQASIIESEQADVILQRAKLELQKIAKPIEVIADSSSTENKNKKTN